MKIYSRKQVETILCKANFPKGLSLSQHFMVLWWALFKHKKLYKFCECIEKGKHLLFAFEDANE